LFSQDRVILGLCPSSIRLATMSGRVIRLFQRHMIDPTDWDETWSKGLRPLDPVVLEMMRRLDIPRGALTTVLYQSPTLVADVFSVKARQSAATQAASLAMRDYLMAAAMQSRFAQTVLSTDRDPTAGRTHVLSVADHNEACESIAGLVSRCGLQLDRVLPSKADLMISASELIHRLPSTPKSALVVLDEHSTVIASGDAEQLRFVRSIEFGYAQLGEAFLRGMGSNGAASPTETDREAAYLLLFKCGIPQRNQVIDAARNLTGATVIPALQSVIQRYVVEIRQSLRFAFSEAEFARANIYITGSGTLIPHLAKALSLQLDLSVEPLATEAELQEAKLAQEDLFGHLSRAIGRPHASTTLVPLSIERRTNHRTVTSALRIGAVAAAAICVADASHVMSSTFAINKALVSLDPQIVAIEARDERVKELANATYSVNATSSLVKGALGNHPDWTVVLSELSRITVPNLEVVEITGGVSTDELRLPVLSIRGLAQDIEGQDPLSSFIAELSQSKVVLSAKLVSTRTTSENTKTFMIAATLASLPVVLPWEADPEKGATP